MNEIIKNKQFAIAAAIAVALLLLFIVFLYMPKHGAVVKLEKKIKAIDLETEATKSAIGDIRNLGKALALMQQELNNFESKLPAEEELSSILSEITDTAKKHSIEVVSVKPGKPVLFQDSSGGAFEFDQKKVKKINIDVDLRGAYKYLVEYIKALRDSMKILAVLESVSITRNEKIAPKLEANFSLTIFVLG